MKKCLKGDTDFKKELNADCGSGFITCRSATPINTRFSQVGIKFDLINNFKLKFGDSGLYFVQE